VGGARSGWCEAFLTGIRNSYIRPMYWQREALPAEYVLIRSQPAGVFASMRQQLPKPSGSSITLSPFRRPPWVCTSRRQSGMPLYPNNARAYDRGAGAAGSIIAFCATCSVTSPSLAHCKRVHGKGWSCLYASSKMEPSVDGITRQRVSHFTKHQCDRRRDEPDIFRFRRRR